MTYEFYRNDRKLCITLRVPDDWSDEAREWVRNEMVVRMAAKGYLIRCEGNKFIINEGGAK